MRRARYQIWLSAAPLYDGPIFRAAISGPVESASRGPWLTPHAS